MRGSKDPRPVARCEAREISSEEECVTLSDRTSLLSGSAVGSPHRNRTNRHSGPTRSGIHLLSSLLTAEVFVKDVVKKLIGQCMVGFGPQGVLGLPQKSHALDGSLT